MEERSRRGKQMQFGDNEKESKEAIKIELSKMISQHSPPVKVPDVHVLAARVNTKGSCVEAAANPLGEEPSAFDVATMGLYIVVE